MQQILTVVGLFLGLMILWNIVRMAAHVLFGTHTDLFAGHAGRIYDRVPARLQNQYEPYLRNFSYYTRLSPRSRNRFIYRLHHFVTTRTFTGREGLEITDEIRTLISASAVQICFGLDKYLLDHFTTIVIYPDIFHNRRLDQYHKGETNVKGAIVFSWKHFQEGYAVENDKYNLGLHEMAHALELSRRLEDFDFYFAQYFSKWAAVALYEYKNINDNRASFLREYAGTNLQEFFAVCVEHFFEAPKEFSERLPEIYRHMTILLKQDPLLSFEKSLEAAHERTNKIPARQYLNGPRFSTRFSFGYMHWQVVVFILFLVYLYVQDPDAPEASLPFRSLLLVFGGLATVQGYFLFARFDLYEHHLVIRRPGSLRAIALQNIAKVVFRKERYDSVEIAYIDDTDMLFVRTYFSMPEPDATRLIALLTEHDVIVRAGAFMDDAVTASATGPKG